MICCQAADGSETLLAERAKAPGVAATRTEPPPARASYPMKTSGCRVASGSGFADQFADALHGTLPGAPNKKKPMAAPKGFSSDQPKWISGGLPTRDNSNAIVAITWASEPQQRDTDYETRPSSSLTASAGCAETRWDRPIRPR